MQTRVEDEKDMAFIKIRGVIVGMLVEIAPDVYKSYVTKDKKGFHSCWFSARTLYVELWLQVCCATVSLPNV